MFDWCNQMRLQLAEVQSRSTTLIGSHLWLYRLPVPSPSNWTSLFWNSPRTSPKFGKFFFFTDIQLNQIFNILFCSLDFMSFSIGQPNANGDCATDVFKVTGADNLVPNICGDNAGQHSKFNSNRNFCQFMLNCIHFPLVYLDVPSRSAGTSMTSPASREINLSFQLGAQSSASRMWNIKVSMLPSGSKYLGMPAHFKLLI